MIRLKSPKLSSYLIGPWEIPFDICSLNLVVLPKNTEWLIALVLKNTVDAEESFYLLLNLLVIFTCLLVLYFVVGLFST